MEDTLFKGQLHYRFHEQLDYDGWRTHAGQLHYRFQEQLDDDGCQWLLGGEASAGVAFQIGQLSYDWVLGMLWIYHGKPWTYLVQSGLATVQCPSPS